MGSFLSGLGGVLSNVSAGYADPTFAARMLQKDKDRVKAKEDAKELKKFEADLGLDTEDEKRTREDKYISGFLSTLTGGDQAKTAELLAQARSGSAAKNALEGRRALAAIPGTDEQVNAEQNADIAKNRLLSIVAQTDLEKGLPGAEADARLEEAKARMAQALSTVSVNPYKTDNEIQRLSYDSQNIPLRATAEASKLNEGMANTKSRIVTEGAELGARQKDIADENSLRRDKRKALRNEYRSSVPANRLKGQRARGMSNVLSGTNKPMNEEQRILLGLTSIAPSEAEVQYRTKPSLLGESVDLESALSNLKDRFNASTSNSAPAAVAAPVVENPPKNPTPKTSTRRRRDEPYQGIY